MTIITTTGLKLKIVSILGQGGFGVVYKTRDEFGNHYVMKIVDDEKSYENEIRALLKFKSLKKHLNYLPHMKIEGAHTIFMEYIEGSVDLKKARGISYHDLAQIMLDCILQLEAFHKLKMYHTDIKMENILVYKRNGEKRGMIIDYGLLSEMKDISRSRDGRILQGTMLYTSPYLLRRKKDISDYLYANDIYALGRSILRKLNEELEEEMRQIEYEKESELLNVEPEDFRYLIAKSRKDTIGKIKRLLSLKLKEKDFLSDAIFETLIMEKPNVFKIKKMLQKSILSLSPVKSVSRIKSSKTTSSNARTSMRTKTVSN